ncbi:hypothetical protein F5878DRAFT_635651 [Lentinula raphanica]|uniref:Uncharacterized protein n=1 Tax=Lentinula raphanica TaxID=153919 RepID=A0AA38NWQ6_9AGAR|nr:hypothetical protein F5878DRAFT_635651 [Lentinula raphanica]
MSPHSQRKSANRPTFNNDSYFVRRSNKWFCTLCGQRARLMSFREAKNHETSSKDHALHVKAQLSQQQQQQQHTESPAWDEPNIWETQGPSVEAWLTPTTEDVRLMTKEQLRTKEHQYFADQVDDMVPFWIRGIEAAEQGEVLKLEEFLDSLETDSWPPRGPNPWAHVDRYSTYGGRAAREPEPRSPDAAKWNVESISSMSADSGRATGKLADRDAVLPASSSYNIHSDSILGRKSESLVEIVARQNAVDDHRKREMYYFLELPTNEKVKKIDDLIRSMSSS